MSVLTRCTTPAAARPGASGHWLLFILFVAALLLMFGLGQLHLQFSVDDMERETNSLQSRKMELQSSIAALRSEVESRKKGDRLILFAEAEFGMVQYPAANRERLVVAERVKDRYLDVQVASVEATPARKESWVASLAQRVGIDAAAFAKE